MARRKISIIGGGLAGLSTALALTRTPELRERHQVTVYQMGWRLGGKCASGRRFSALDPGGVANGKEGHRNESHGLHVWFGFYANAFRMIQEVYDELQTEHDDPFRHWTDALEPWHKTAYGGAGDKSLYRFTWPELDGMAGAPPQIPNPWQAFVRMLKLIHMLLDGISDDQQDINLPSWVMPLFMETGHTDRDPVAVPEDRAAAVQLAHEWAARFDGDHRRHPPHHLHGILALLHATRGENSPPVHFIDELLHVAAAFATGFVHDFLLGEETTESLDRIDFRDWLVRHGCNAGVARHALIVRVLYDTMFQYLEGNPLNPSYAAGTACQVLLRALGTSHEAIFFLMRSGMGDVVIAPIYRVLRQRGVRFEFFHKLHHLELNTNKSEVDRVHFNIQALVKGNDYAPLTKVGAVHVWPSRPLWGQLKNGKALKASGVDFESHWCSEEPKGTKILERGKDYHDLVLAISLGAFKPLNHQNGPCDELIKANQKFSDMAHRIGLVPSVSAQIWTTLSARKLSWDGTISVGCSGPMPLDVWSDNPAALTYETWPDQPANARPAGVHSLCGVMNTRLYRRPSWETDTQAEANTLAQQIGYRRIAWQSQRFWPDAYDADGMFREETLFVPEGENAENPYSAQYYRANISPTECVVGSAAGSTRWRLRSDESGFGHLLLAGCWTNTGLNTSCVEAAVMSGLQAARALSGDRRIIFGEDFFSELRSPLLSLCRRVKRSLCGKVKPRFKQHRKNRY